MISLVFVLASLNLVCGQIPDRFARQGDPDSTNYTGQIRSFAEFGAGLNTNPPPLLCHAAGIGNVVMTSPNGSLIDVSRVHPASPATGGQLYISGWPGNRAVVLHRGPDYFSPDGEYCCWRKNGSDAQYLIKNEMICLTLTSCPTLTPVNGTITYDATTNQANYTCNDGYTLSGTSPITCNETTSSWSATQPTCQVLCPQEPLSNGMTTYSSSEYPLPEGTVANYSCNTGYDFTGNHTRTCLKGGWNDPLPFCNASCPRHSLSNGMVNYSTATDPPPTGTVANYSCNIGYNLNGTETRTCVDTIGWSSTLPVCNIVECGQPEYPENGTVITPLGIAHVYNEQVRYFCESGYNLNGSATRTCKADGQWSPAVPICQPVNCGALMNPTNGQVTTTGTTFTNTANYSCDVGYTLNGPSTRRCEVSGVWSQPNQNTTCDNTDSDPPPTDNIPNTGSNNLSTTARDFSTSISILSITDFLTLPTTIMNPSITARDFLTTVSILSTTTQDSTLSNTIINPSTTVSNSSTTVSILSTISMNPSTTDNTFLTSNNTLPTTDISLIVGAICSALIIIGLITAGIIIAAIARRQGHPRQRRDFMYKPETGMEEKQLFPPSPKSVLELQTTSFTEPTILEFPVDCVATEGEEVYLRVRVRGHPPSTITWYHDGNRVTPDYATELDTDGGITFPCVEAKHAGTYKLMVSHSSGDIERQLQLTVRDENEQTATPESVDLSPVPVDQFGVFVAEMHAIENQKFKDSYKAMDSGEKGHGVTVGQSPENKQYNRFKNIVVYDDNRIILQAIDGREDCQSDYVNACYVDGYNYPRKFIASQGPNKQSVVDFWHLVWQERSPIIVMLTNLEEGNKVKCEPYWPESDKKTFGPFTVTITDQQTFADFVIRTFEVILEGDSKSFKTTQFHFTSWPDHGVPDYSAPILRFHRRVKSQHKPPQGPLLVHCSAGVGRTGTYIVIDNVLDQIAAEGLVDISGAVVKARNQRMKMVQTQEQYMFIHDSILESVTCGDTEIKASNLKSKILKLSEESTGKNCTGFEHQFQILEQVSPNPIETISKIALSHPDKNRGNQYLPTEKNRVILQREYPDYIHAVFVNGYKQQKAYIIAQNPLPSTIRNFWKVIYDKKCSGIVMLTPLSENGQEVCSQYWPPSGIKTIFGEFTINSLGEEKNPSFIIRKLEVICNKTQKSHQVTQFQILNWNPDGTCTNFKIVTDINEEVIKVQQRTGNKFLVVHCSDTATRCGMYCSIATIIDRCKTEGVVDVFQVVKALRTHKPGAVPSVDNYRAIFTAISVYLDSFDTYANFI